MKPSATCQEELQALQHLLASTRATVKAGTMPKMTGIDKRIADVCVRIQQADKPVQQECIPILTSLVQSLDAVSEEMHAWHQREVANGKMK